MKIALNDYLEMEDQPTVYIMAMGECKKVEYVTRDMWAVTGTGLDQRSWCLHGGSPLYTTCEEAIAAYEREQKWMNNLIAKYK